MAKNKIYNATIKSSDEKIEVYVLKQPHPTKEHVWCNYKDCKTVYKDSELITNL